MSWSLKFDEPIELANGETLRTLRDAGNYATALSKKEVVLPHWQVAAQCLLAAVEKGERLREEAETKPPGQERDALLRKARQADTAAHIDEWICSPGLRRRNKGRG